MSHETYLGYKGYSIYKKSLSLKEQVFIREELTVKPYMPKSPVQPTPYPIYRESTRKFYIPRSFGINTFGEPNETSLPYLSMDVLRSGVVSEYCHESDGVRVEENDLLILWDGSKSGEILLGQNGILSSTMSNMKLIDVGLDKKFSYYLLKFYEVDFQVNTVGMGIPHVDGNHLKFSKILLMKAFFFCLCRIILKSKLLCFI